MRLRLQLLARGLIFILPVLLVTGRMKIRPRASS
jgi:hypothetical protein